MSWELMLWLFAFVSVIALIGLSLYQLITLSDLEFDYINPFDSSNRINAVVLPEFMLQALLCASFFLTFHWFTFLICLPVTCYHLNLYMKRKHLVDVTEIFRLLHWEKKYRIIKLALYVTLFVIVIYRLVLTAVTLVMDDEDEKKTFLGILKRPARVSRSNGTEPYTNINMPDSQLLLK